MRPWCPGANSRVSILSQSGAKKQKYWQNWLNFYNHLCVDLANWICWWRMFSSIKTIRKVNVDFAEGADKFSFVKYVSGQDSEDIMENSVRGIWKYSFICKFMDFFQTKLRTWTKEYCLPCIKMKHLVIPFTAYLFF